MYIYSDDQANKQTEAWTQSSARDCRPDMASAVTAAAARVGSACRRFAKGTERDDCFIIIWLSAVAEATGADYAALNH